MPSVREYPITVAAVPVVVLAIAHSVLTPTNVLLGVLAATLLVGVAVLLDRAQISWHSPREYRATLLVLPVVIALGLYTILTPTNVLLWVLAGSALLGVGFVVDLAASDDDAN